MRVLYFIGAYGPHLLGNDVHEETCEYLLSKGHMVEVLTPGGAPEGVDEAEGGIAVHRLAPRSGLKASAGRKISQRLLKYDRFLDVLGSYRRFQQGRKGAYDLVHAEAAYPFAAIATLADPSGKTPVVVNLQGADVMSCPEVDYGYARYALPRYLTSIALRRAKAVRANSYRTEQLALAFGAGRRKTETIPRNVRGRAYLPPGVSLPGFRLESRHSLEQHLGLPEDARIVIALSRLHPFKGIEYLVRAMPLVRRQVREAVLVICGPSRSTPRYGDYVQFLQKLAAAQGVAESTLFTGAVGYDDARSYLAAADLLVVPSVVEALNKVVIEAAAVGTPSVVTSSTGIADFVVQGGCGLVVPPCDEAALAAAVCRLLGDEDLYRGASLKGPSFAGGFRTEIITERLLRLYER